MSLSEPDYETMSSNVLRLEEKIAQLKAEREELFEALKTLSWLFRKELKELPSRKEEIDNLLAKLSKGQ